MSAFPPRDPSTPDSIPRRNLAAREADPVDFLALRALGIAQTQLASGKRWTDYNVHDPGVTILEQLSFALTELAYRIDFPVADHLAGPSGKIDYTAQALFPPQDILPCRPTTANDYRRLLLDQVTDLRDARFMSPEDMPGLHRLRLRVAHRAHGETAIRAACRKGVRDAYRLNRALGEDLHDQLRVIRTRYCELILHAEIEGMRDPAEIVADIYRCCEDAIAGGAKARGFEDLLRSDWTLDRIFDGPTTLAGRIDDTQLKAMDRGRLALSTLRALLVGIPGDPAFPGIPGLASVSRLDLAFENDDADGDADEDEAETDRLADSPIDGGVLTWNPDEWAPCLRTPGEGRKAADLTCIHLTRRGVPVELNPRSVARRYLDDARPSASDRPTSRKFETVVPPIDGQPRKPVPYESVQNQFPALYGLGPRGPADPTPLGRARVEQLKGYLALFDHVLANGAAQLDHIRDLFTPDRGRWHSYWRGVLADEEVTGIEELYLDASKEVWPDELRTSDTPAERERVRRNRAERIRRQIHADAHTPFDDAVDRRHRALDYLLALYGESLAQNTSRQYLNFLSSRELDPVLLANKVAYLTETVTLGRDRAGGFDYHKELWNPAEHSTPAVHARICLLLAFPLWNARALTRPVAPWKPKSYQPISGPSESDPSPARPDPKHLAPAMSDRSRPLAWPPWGPAKAGDPPGLTPDQLQQRLTDVQAQRVMHGDLFIDGVWRRRYRWEADQHGPGGQLLLGADRQKWWWRLGTFESERQAGEFAHALRRGLRCLNDLSEGLHIVEHVLLRPRGDDKGRLEPSFHALRATFVFPNWGARTSLPEFQAFAEETVRINCPAHVEPNCLWLSFAAMREFEGLYSAWLNLLRGYKPTERRNDQLEEHAGRLDETAAKLEAFLIKHLALQSAN